MNVSQSFRLALKSLMVSKVRALLTMLGIIIGVAAVIVIVSLGNGMQQYMNAQFEQIGVNLIQVAIYSYGGNREVEPDDMYALAEKYPQYIDSVSPYLSASTTVRRGADEYDHTSVYGVSETFYNAEKGQTASGDQLEEGRFLSYVDVERDQKVCVIPQRGYVWRGRPGPDPDRGGHSLQDHRHPGTEGRLHRGQRG